MDNPKTKERTMDTNVAQLYDDLRKKSLNVKQNHLKLPVGLGSEMMAEIKGINMRMKVSVVGMETGKFLLAKVYSNDLIGTFRSDAIRSNPVNISYMHNNTVYGFSSEVISIVSHPSRMFFFKYPEKVEKVTRRTNSRYECYLSAFTMFGNDIADLVITDISPQGCKCEIKSPLSPNSSAYHLLRVDKMIDLRVQFPGSVTQSGLLCRIRTISNEENTIKLGLMFKDITPETDKELNKFISLLS